MLASIKSAATSAIWGPQEKPGISKEKKIEIATKQADGALTNASKGHIKDNLEAFDTAISKLESLTGKDQSELKLELLKDHGLTAKYEEHTLGRILASPKGQELQKLSNGAFAQAIKKSCTALKSPLAVITYLTQFATAAWSFTSHQDAFPNAPSTLYDLCKTAIHECFEVFTKTLQPGGTYADFDPSQNFYGAASLKGNATEIASIPNSVFATMLGKLEGVVQYANVTSGGSTLFSSTANVLNSGVVVSVQSNVKAVGDALAQKFVELVQPSFPGPGPGPTPDPSTGGATDSWSFTNAIKNPAWPIIGTFVATRFVHKFISPDLPIFLNFDKFNGLERDFNNISDKIAQLEAAFNAEQQKTLTVIAGGNARAAEVPLMNRNRAKHHAEITKLYTKAQGYLARMNTIATTPSGISTYFGICGCHMCGTDRALTGNSADHVERQRVCGLDLARLNLIVQARNADIV